MPNDFDHLVEQARRLGCHPSDEAAVTAALREYVQRHKQTEIIKLFGTIDFDPEWDYKADRKHGQRTRNSPER